MAEQVQTSEIANTQLANKSIVSSIGNTLEKLRKFSNEPAVQRSIPVMITLFVIIISEFEMLFEISFFCLSL